MITEVDGLQAHATTGGISEQDPNQEAVVLIHGAGMDSSVWFLQTRYLAYRGFRVFAVDLPGHGQSNGEALTTITEMANWLSRFLQTAGIERAHLAGHSMGTYVALELAATTPRQVRSLALLGTAPNMPVHPQLLADARDNLPAAAALMTAWSHGNPAHVGLHPTPGLWMLGGARALVERSRPGVLETDFFACANYEGAMAAAGEVTCPSTVIIGASDKMTPPRAGLELAERLQESTVISLANVGHMMMVENPTEVKRILLKAFRST